MTKKFNPDNKTKEDLLIYARKLESKYIGDIIDKEILSKRDIKNKGALGQLIEEEYFYLKNNNRQGPDFEYSGTELKAAPLRALKKEKEGSMYSPKERVKISSINFQDIVDNENIQNSQLWLKMKRILFIWYISIKQDFDKNKIYKADLFELIEWEQILGVISKDWEFLRKMVLNGEAHRFSEGLTNFLGVARSGGSKNEKKISQYTDGEPLYKRSFTFKTSLLRQIFLHSNYQLESYSTKNIIHGLDEKIIKMKNKYQSSNTLFEDDLKSKFSIIKDKSIKDIWEKKYSIKGKKIPKDAASRIFQRIYKQKSLEDVSSIVMDEFGKEYSFKTIPVTFKEGKYKMAEEWKININLMKEIKKEWFYSEYSKCLENKYIVIILKKMESGFENNIFIEYKIIDFSQKELDEVNYAFEYMKNGYEKGGLVNKKTGKFIPIKKSDKTGVHIRPSAVNSKNPKTSKAGEKFVNQAIWINSEIIDKKINS